MRYEIPRGIRNNNPLNIRVGNNLARWAPAKENHTKKYINFVYDKTGIDRGTKITFKEAHPICWIVYVMACYENGSIPCELDLHAKIYKAYQMIS